MLKSTLELLAAYMTASLPYGTPNLPTDSLELNNLSCSGVGPVLGYTKSVRTSVCVKGEDMELIDIVDGLLRFWKFELERVRVRDMVRRAELERLLNAEPPEREGR